MEHKPPRKLRKSYPVMLAAVSVSALYQDNGLMPVVAYGTRDGAIFQGMGVDRAEALNDLALRMLGHDEEAWRLKVITK